MGEVGYQVKRGRFVVGLIASLCVLAVIVGIVALRDGSAGVDATPAEIYNPPFAAGSSAGNIQLGPERSRAKVEAKRVLVRWVARHTGMLQTLYLQLKSSSNQPFNCPDSPNGYGGGTSGLAEFITYRVNPNGTPRLQRPLRRTRLVPCTAASSGSVAVRMGFQVTKGQEFATVIRNAAPNPRQDYFSVNFLYNAGGVLGANGRNERSAAAKDVYYGLDPRELVGFSYNGGRTWELPYGRRRHLPTYLQVYADGYRDGQPYHYPTCPCPGAMSGTVTMVFPRVPVPWTIRQLGAFTLPPGGSARVELLVNETVVRSATLAGTGMLRAAIEPIEVQPGATVSVRTTAGSDGLALQRIDADTNWKFGPVLTLGPSWRWYFLEALGPGAADRSAVTVYPLPFYGAEMSP